jgi:hypothetical protein
MKRKDLPFSEGGREEKVNLCEEDQGNVPWRIGRICVHASSEKRHQMHPVRGRMCLHLHGKHLSIKNTATMRFSTGRLSLISPTDCVKDRLAAYFHWNDKQCLEQARLVSESWKIDIEEIRRWSKGENKIEEFESIYEMLVKGRSRRKK